MTTTGSIAAMGKAAEQLAAAKLGYDQSQRWSFFKQGKIVAGQETDCSSMCGAIAKLGGYDVDLTGTFYTGNFAAKLKAAGFTILRYTGLSQVRQGDFIVSPGAHVEYAYSTSRWISARTDERGKASGGKAGNQGDDVGWGQPYDMGKRGTRTTYICRPPDSELRRGDQGAAVKALQVALLKTSHGGLVAAAGGADGSFGAGTEQAVKAVQKAAGIAQDGVVGPDTRRALDSALAPPPTQPVPVPEVPTVPTDPPAELSAIELFGSANCQSYDGSKTEAAWRARARIMASKGWSVVSLQESTAAGRKVMCDELKKLTGHTWKAQDLDGKTVAVMWDDTVWSARKPRGKRFGSPPTAFGHGVLIQPLLHRLTRIGVDVGSVHVRPKSIATVAKKEADVAVVRGQTKGWPWAIAGDWCLDHPAGPGIRATPVVDTVKSDGGANSRVDAVFIGGKIGAGKATKVDPGPLSDHLWWGVEIVLGGSTL